MGGTDSQDWITLTVPAGLQLSSLTLASYVSADVQGFTGVQAGTAFVGSVNDPAAYLGYAHFGTAADNGSLPTANLVGVDILPIMGNPSAAPGSQGFTPPLGSGSYVFLIQQLGCHSYEFDYGVCDSRTAFSRDHRNPPPDWFSNVVSASQGSLFHWMERVNRQNPFQVNYRGDRLTLFALEQAFASEHDYFLPGSVSASASFR